MEGSISQSALAQTLNFHGQTLCKLCESSPKLQNTLNLISPQNIHYKDFIHRQRHLSFQDRGKRLRIQEFIVKHAEKLFDDTWIHSDPPRKASSTSDEVSNYYSNNPPFEAFSPADKESKIRRFYETTPVGSTLICVVATRQSVYGVRLLVVEGEKPYVVAETGLKAALPPQSVLGNRPLAVGDHVRCTVLEIVPEADKLVIGDAVPYTEPLPAAYRKLMEAKNKTYDELLHENIGFGNPGNIGYLTGVLGLGSQNLSNLLSLRHGFAYEEHAQELRQQQAGKWAFKSVAEGIEHFKAGRHSDAFQCLNRALSIDPRNVEGLVARGALYANSGTFDKAVDDFDAALNVNPNHLNARKYMGETLVALGRSYEEKQQMDEAMSAYQRCLQLLPYHEEAQNSIDFLRSKNLVPPQNASGKDGSKDGIVSSADELMKSNSSKKTKKKDKKKKAKRKKARGGASSSGSSTSSSSTSSDSSSDSSSSSGSSSDSDDSSSHKKSKKKKRTRSKDRKKSLSPLSKRMLLDSGADLEAPQRNQFNPTSLTSNSNDSEYELRVRAFLEQIKGDSDYEDKVHKFLAETSRLKLGSGKLDDKSSSKKKNKKKEKKERKEKAKKQRRREEKRKKRAGKKGLTGAIEDEDDDEMEQLLMREALRKELTMKQELKRRVAAHESVLAAQSNNSSINANTFSLNVTANNAQTNDSHIAISSEPVLGGFGIKLKELPKKLEERTTLLLNDQETPPLPPEPAPHMRPLLHGTESEERRITVTPLGDPRAQSKKERLEAFRAANQIQQQQSTNPHSLLGAHKLQSPPPLPPGDPMPPVKTTMDKFSFRTKVFDEQQEKGVINRGQQPQQRRQFSPTGSASSGGEGVPARKSRSHSYSYGSRSRSRSRSGSGDSSGSSRSRSRSRRRSYDSRSRSRSRSPRYRNRFRGNNRGTYYRPRFQNQMNYHHRGNHRNWVDYGRGGGNRGFYRYDNRYNNRGGNRGGYQNYNNRGGSRGRRGFYNNNRGFYDNRRRYRSPRDRGNSSPRSGSGSPGPDDDRDHEDHRKGSEDRDLDRSGDHDEMKNRDEPLSEGETRDSPAVQAAANSSAADKQDD